MNISHTATAKIFKLFEMFNDVKLELTLDLLELNHTFELIHCFILTISICTSISFSDKVFRYVINNKELFNVPVSNYW